MGCPLRSDAAYLVISSVGTKPMELLQELGRIRTEVGEIDSPLTADDLRGKLTSSFESTPFEFAEALLAFDRRAATRSLTAMYSRGAQGRDGVRVDQGGLFPFITGWLYQSLAQLHEGRLLLDSGTTLAEVPRRLGVRVFVDRFQGQLLHNPEPRLRRGLLLLHRCQRELRRTSEDPGLLLQGFLGRYFAEDAT